MVPYKYNQCPLLDGSQRSDFVVIAVLLAFIHKREPRLESYRLKDEYFMAISAVADPPVAIRIRFSAMICCDRCIAHQFSLHMLRPFLPQYDPAVVQRLTALVGTGR